MVDFRGNGRAVLNRRRKAEKIADWCAANHYDPAVIVDPAQRRQIVRYALGVRVLPDGTKRYPRASDDTWAEVVRVYDEQRARQAWGEWAAPAF